MTRSSASAPRSSHISTSLDGPQELHNGNRRRPGRDSWQQAVAGIRRVQERLGPDRVSALMTTTEASLGRAAEIIDSYAGTRTARRIPASDLAVRLRTARPRRRELRRRPMARVLPTGLARIVELNRQGVPMVEIYASIIAKKMLTNTDPGYVDLTSPAGHRDRRARLQLRRRHLRQRRGPDARRDGRPHIQARQRARRFLRRTSCSPTPCSSPLTESITLSAPMCTTCAFEPYCGADPVFHHATMGDFTGHKALSAFCQRNMGVFTLAAAEDARRPLFPRT